MQTTPDSYRKEFTAEEACHWAGRLGFTCFADVLGVSSINTVPIFTEKGVSGVYVLFRVDGTVYIGQSTNVPRRFKSHCWDGYCAVHFLGFRPCPKKDLIERETATIAKARFLGLPVTNLAQTDRPAPRDNRPFDEVFPPERQEAFIRGIASGHSTLNQWTNFLTHAPVAERAAWRSFTSMHPSDKIVEAGRRYLRTAILDPKATIGTWCLTGLMYTKLTSRLSILRIHAGMLVGLEIYSYRRVPGQIFADVALDTRYLKEAFGNINGNRLEVLFPWATFEKGEESDISADALMNRLNVRGQPDVAMGSPEKTASAMARPVTMANYAAATVMTLPLDSLNETLSNPRIATAAALVTTASMRSSAPITSDHCSVVAFKLLEGLDF